MKILLVVARSPHLPRRGDQLRTVQALEALCPHHEVTLLAPEPAARVPSSLSAASPTRGARLVTYRPPSLPRRLIGVGRAAVSSLPLQAGLFAASGLATALERHVPEADCVVLQLVRLAPHLDRVGSATPVVVDLVDSLALSVARRAELDRPWLAPALREEARRLARWERRLAERAERTLLVSQRDRDAVAARVSPAAAARLRVLPVAVPVVDAAPEGARRAAGPPVLAVTGSLGYFPTREGVHWFLDEVWPRLRSARPDVRLVLAGSRPPSWLVRRAPREGIELRVDPPHLGATLAESTIALAPMRCGAGQPLKVFEAWAASVPVVATPWTAAGAAARPGRDLMVADGADEWLGSILALLDDPARAGELAASARRLLADRYSAGAVADGWLEAVSATAAARSLA